MKFIIFLYTDYQATKSRKVRLTKVSVFKNYIGHASETMNWNMF